MALADLITSKNLNRPIFLRYLQSLTSGKALVQDVRKYNQLCSRFYLSLVGCLLLCAPEAFGFSIGVEGGLSLAQQKKEPLVSSTLSKLVGPAGGVFLDFPLSQWLFFGPEVLYVQKGTKLDILTLEASYAYNYVDLPLLLKVRLGKQRFAFTLFAGPAVGYLVSAKSTSLGTTSDISSQVKKVDFSAHLGAAFEVRMGKRTKMFVSARYMLGLQDMENDGVASSSTKNNAIIGLVGFVFGFGKTR